MHAYVYMYWYACAMAGMWSSEGIFGEVIHSYHIGSWNQIQMIRFDASTFVH